MEGPPLSPSMSIVFILSLGGDISMKSYEVDACSAGLLCKSLLSREGEKNVLLYQPYSYLYIFPPPNNKDL